MLLCFGTAPLLNSIGNPNLRGIDIVRLMASGFCYGVAFVALIGNLKRRNE